MACSIGTDLARRRRRIFILALFCAAVAGSSRGLADVTPVDKAAALTAFEEGRVLFGQSKYAEACARFERSQKLDPQLGTLLNLAICHEKVGKFGTAWLEYTDARDQAKRDKRTDRLPWIEKQLADLKSRVPFVVVDVPSETRVAGLEVTLDGARLRETAWAIEIPIDPGDHELVAKAPGYAEHRERFSVSGEGERKRVTVAPLVADARPAPSSQPPVAPPPSAPPRDPAHLPALAAGVGGAVLLGTGTFFGLRAITLRSDAETACQRGVCDGEGRSLNRRANAAAWISDGAFVLGFVGVGLSAYLLLRPRPEAPPPAAAFAPYVGPGGGGVSVTGSF